ncbi:MAG: NAD-dependent epimerase/dehydratase family protein [bacterium]
METILVTGGTGAVGPRIVDVLVAEGYAVRILALDVPKPGALPPGVELRLGSVTDPDAVREAVRDCAGVVHMAALLHIVNPPPSRRAQYEAVNVGGTRTVLAAAQASGVQRVVFFSTIAVYGYGGQGNGQWAIGNQKILTEESPCQPDTFYGETKLAAEKLVLETQRPDNAPLGTILRMGAIYGSGIKGNYRKLALALAKHRFVPVGTGQNRRSLIYDRDVATATVLALRTPQAAGQVYNVTDNRFHTLAEIIAAICVALGRRLPRLRIPLVAARLAAAGADLFLRLAGRRPIVRAAVDKYVEEVMVSGDKIQRELGFVPKYSLAAGWKECVVEMRAANEL